MRFGAELESILEGKEESSMERNSYRKIANRDQVTTMNESTEEQVIRIDDGKIYCLFAENVASPCF